MKYLHYTILMAAFLFTGCLNSPEEYNDERDLEYLDEYRLSEGAQETSSGLLYKILDEGEGTSPDPENYVIVTYEGNSYDESLRYSTEELYDMIIPANMQQFSGLGEGIALMNEGSTYEFVLPTELATGDGRVHIFELTLVSFLQENQGQFMENNANNEGVLETGTGLQYRIIEDGEGETPLPTDEVTVRYKGTYTNGFVFDETTGNNTANLNVNGVIQGFSEGLQLMKEGSKFQFFIPPSLGYGTNRPQFGAILVFEVELVSIDS